MNCSLRRKAGFGCALALCAGVLLAGAGLSCGTAPTAELVVGPGVTGDDPPTLTILEPNSNITRGRGDSFVVRWTDSDRDSNASISFELVNSETNDRILLVQGIEENDLTGPDSFTASTTPIPFGTYNILGTIYDGVNLPVSTYAAAATGTVSQRLVLTIVEPGQGPQTVPPIITVTEPAFNLSVAQDDVLTVTVQPSELAPEAGTPYDPDSSFTVYILLDLDQDPNNDDPANPDPLEIIVLAEVLVQAGAFEPISRSIPIDLSTISPRSDGEPYYIRATADDATNPRVHQYAVGAISVVELAAGVVDLFDVGRTKSGARFYGFNPGASLGSSVATISDFDADSVDDFVLVAQYGNPRNFGLIGEAYGIYGRDGVRFGGSIGVNSIGEIISGVIFEAPPKRAGSFTIPGSDARTDGISDVSFIRDLSGDGRPEILFGLQHVHGAWEAMDFDPGDSDFETSDTSLQVELSLRQGEVRYTVGEEDPEIDTSYRGCDDVGISSASPSMATGSLAELTWRDNGPGQREWVLIRFTDVLRELPDTAATIDETTISASLQLRVFNTGGAGTLHRCLTDFGEQTTFDTFAVNGGEPQGGVDYVEEGGQGGGLGSVNGDQAESVEIDVSDVVRQLVDGLLTGSDNELRFIIVPAGDDESPNQTGARSGEFSIEADRPTLNIQYTREGAVGSLDCYPDHIVNNVTTQDDENYVGADSYWYAGGMAIVVNSQNRDNSGPINPLRLESTVVSLELVGVENEVILDARGVEETGAPIFARADNAGAQPLDGEQSQAGRISGARIVAGGFDWIDARDLAQGPREGLFGQKVSSIGDLNNDGIDEIIISAPGNERYLADLFANFGFQSTQWWSTVFKGSILVIPGFNYNDNSWREKNDNTNGNAVLPVLDQFRDGEPGQCTQPPFPRSLWFPADAFNVFAENVDDMLGGASSPGDFNLDGVDDILCGAPRNDRSNGLPDTGAVYVLYGRNVLGSFDLKLADDPLQRPPMLRIRGVKRGDQIGWVQTGALDVDGDRLDDILFASPTTDFGNVRRNTCDTGDLRSSSFSSCRNAFRNDDLFSDDSCKVFDYNYDGLIDGEDQEVFRCLQDGGGDSCCANLVDNGFVGIVFGGVFTTGDREITQIATSDLPGVIFYGSGAGHRAGLDISSAGDFNKDGFGDILIAVPGETRVDRAGRERLGVVYMVFGGTHLKNTVWSLAQVGSADLPGIVFMSPYVKGQPNEAAPTTVADIGDINNDGFGDIAIGNPKADFIDLSFPQGPEATDASLGRRRNAGDAYIIYGNNFGSNRAIP